MGCFVFPSYNLGLNCEGSDSMGSFFSCQANRYLVKMVIAELLKIFSKYLSIIHFLVRFRAVRMVNLLPRDSRTGLWTTVGLNLDLC